MKDQEQKTVALRFKKDVIRNDEVIFEAGKTYNIPVEGGSADRWIKRGAEIVGSDDPVAGEVKESGKTVATSPAKPQTKKEKEAAAKKAKEEAEKAAKLAAEQAAKLAEQEAKDEADKKAEDEL